MLFTGIISVALLGSIHALENGLARTPPMGWMAWERFRCITDCQNFPDECISEQLFRRTADLMVSEGYAAVGYEYVIIDDCWLAKERDINGRLQPDPERFPNGIKALAEYIHSKGLKFGLYEDYGNFTCAGYPGVIDNLELDAQTFADWDVDYVKLDGCYAEPEDMNIGYPAFGAYLNKTGRPMVYSCSWPVYQEWSGIEPNFESLKKTCNLWRNYGDIQDSWSSTADIINYFRKNQDRIVQHAGPGHWNDPDMLIIGNYGLSYEQSKTQMALWAILAAPLIMSAELRDMHPGYKAILQNKQIIAINQDELGIQGRNIKEVSNIQIWTRPITPVVDGQFSYAIVFFSQRTDGYPYPVTVTLKDLGLTYARGYVVQDLYDSENTPQVLTPDSKLSVRVKPSGVMFFRATVVPEKIATTNSKKHIYGLNYWN